MFARGRAWEQGYSFPTSSLSHLLTHSLFFSSQPLDKAPLQAAEDSSTVDMEFEPVQHSHSAVAQPEDLTKKEPSLPQAIAHTLSTE